MASLSSDLLDIMRKRTGQWGSAYSTTLRWPRQYALKHHGMERVAIVDWDLHHGNGTQHSFYDDPRVLFISLHQYPHYPGTGGLREVGGGSGEGFTVNVPMMGGCGDDEYVNVFHMLVAPLLETFRPEMILVSAGFDSARSRSARWHGGNRGRI